MVEPAFEVLKTVGVPSILAGDPSVKPEHVHLIAAYTNKIGLFYLESLAAQNRLPQFMVPELDAQRVRRKKILALTIYLAEQFERQNIQYTIMKTLKPFPYVGSDVDVLVDSPRDFREALNVLMAGGFRLLGHDLFSATLDGRRFDAYVDLQLELSVSGLPYLNKTLITSNATQVPVDATSVRTIKGAPEVVVAACHCFYKEHMYTLADFYTTALALTQETPQSLCRLAEQSNNVVAVAALLAWTHKVANDALGIHLKGVNDALAVLDLPFLSNWAAQQPLTFPFIFPKKFVALALTSKILDDNQLRSSLPRALIASTSPTQYRALVDHFKRSSY